jgi:hypothetical protein
MRKVTKRRAIAGTLADPSLPKTPVTVAGKVYNLCFDLGALAEGETAINAELAREKPPRHLNLLIALPAQDLASTRVMFAAAVRKFHPELGFDEAQRLLTIDSIHDVALAVRAAWEAATPEPEKSADPPQPGK